MGRPTVMKQRFSTAPLVAAAVALLFALTACSDHDAEPDASASVETSGQVVDDVDTAQQVWRDADVESYGFTVTSSCGERAGLGTYAITVDSGDSAVHPQNRGSGRTTVRSIDDLFAQIRQAIDFDADRVDVTYDPTLGFPEHIDIDYILNGIDDEECYRVRDFTVS
jgi:hypothetical protein